MHVYVVLTVFCANVGGGGVMVVVALVGTKRMNGDERRAVVVSMSQL